MSVTIKQVQEAFQTLFEQISEPDFYKTHRFYEWKERDLLVPIRFYLLGRFESIQSETKARKGGESGRVDFLIDDHIAVEVAVRTPECPPSKLLPSQNESEIKKLMQYAGPSVLVLFDSNDNPVSADELNAYKNLPSLGKGNWNRYPFSVLHYYWGTESCECRRMNVRASTD